jgi:hypothetical protein
LQLAHRSFLAKVRPFALTRKTNAAQPGYPFQVRPTHKSNALRAFHFYPLPMPARSSYPISKGVQVLIVSFLIHLKK